MSASKWCIDLPREVPRQISIQVFEEGARKFLAIFLFTFLPAATLCNSYKQEKSRENFSLFSFIKMATNTIIISYKKAYQIYKDLNLAQKRVNDRGKSDFEILEDILHHERVELIDFSDQNLEQERLVSYL